MKTVAKSYPEVYKAHGSPEIDGWGKGYWRPQLHELPDDIIASDDSPDVQCGIFCMMAEEKYKPTENW